ncbi:cobalamin-dependent protein [bacterium]|nr:cobalamin-dependent protein [bacterium]
MTPLVSEAVYNQYFNALLQGDRARCKSIALSLLDQGLNILVLYEQLFRRSLYDIGELWANGLISIAEEHIATAVTESLISQLHEPGIANGTDSRRVIISCVTSDLHQIGARMAANLFESHGWESYYLGANMPITDLLDAIDRVQPHVICLSLALIEHLKILAVTIREIQLRHPRTPIVVGGGAFGNMDSHDQIGFQNVHVLQSMIELERFISSFGESRESP